MNYLLELDDNFHNTISNIYSSLMPKERRLFFLQCKNALRKRQTVGAYLLLSYALWQEYSIEDIRPSFRYNAQGKPYLQNYPHIFFNVSHSGKYILCSLSDREIGCDIQQKPVDDFPNVSATESVVKLGDNVGKEVNTVRLENDDYTLAVSQYGEVCKEVKSVDCKALLAYFAEKSTLSAYVALNANARAKEMLTPLQILREQIAKTPEKTAVVYKNRKMSYRQLDEYSDAMAYRLQNAGVKHGDAVLLSVMPSIEFSIAQWAILKAGGYYVPLNHRWPLERVNYIIEDCGARVMVLDYHRMFFGCNVAEKIICENYDMQTQPFPILNENAQDIFYEIYTSGSTGTPKGVMVSKQNVATFSQNERGSYFHEIVGDNNVNVACICPVSFDMSVGENTTTLLNGATVVFADEEDQLPDNFADFILSHNVKVLWATPSKFKMYLQTDTCKAGLENLQSVVLAGEVLSREIAELSKIYPYKLFNTYAPTETTIISTYCEVKEAQSNVPIGVPFYGESCFILSEDGTLCELEEKGELCIGGNGVALGYMNQETQTREKFIPNPYGEGRMYRTGDVAALDHDGQIRFYGRKDHQVKVNGFRVEMEEVESAIYQYTHKKAVVIYKNGNLIAVAEGKFSKGIADILKEKLPDYMVPALYYEMETFPLNANGKIDRKQVDEYVSKQGLDSVYCPPQNALQAQLISAWEQVIFYRPIGINDSFYALGGDSIDAMRIASALKCQGLEISMYDIMDFKTVREISEAIQAKGKNVIELTPTVFSPETCAKEGAYIAVNEIDNYIKNYRQLSLQAEYAPLKMHKQIICSTTDFDKSIYKIQGTKDVEKVKSAMRYFAQKHAAFRTVYDHLTGLCRQYEYKNSWYIPILEMDKINLSFLREMSLRSRKDDLQYLSYMFVVRDKEDALYAVFALHFCFSDRRTQNNLYEQLLQILNQSVETEKYADFGPYEYANTVRKHKNEFFKQSSPKVREELQSFSNLTSNLALDKYLNGCQCNHFVCKVLPDATLSRKIAKQPLNFLMGIYGDMLRNVSGFERFPIYIIDQNRNASNNKMIHSVIDFIPIVAEGQKDYYTLFKEFLQCKTLGDLLVENETWDKSEGILPFFNYIPVYDDTDSGELTIKEQTQVDIVLERTGGKRISFSAFVKDGMLYMNFDLPTGLDRVEKILRQRLIKESEVNDV